MINSYFILLFHGTRINKIRGDQFGWTFNMNYAEQTNVSLNNYKQVAVIREEQLFVSKCSLGYKLQITIYINFIVYDYLRFMFVLIRIK